MTQPSHTEAAPLHRGWEVIIGLEIHAQIVSQSKLFSPAATSFGAEPNSQVTYVDAGMPGMLPILNKFCVEQAIRTGLGLNATINKVSRFDRKNYFYADLPAGYQISQFYEPIVGPGYLDVELADGHTKRIRIARLHLEQDAGKSIHDQHPQFSFIDLNRAGIALMEIVTEPDMRTAEDVTQFVKKLRTLLRYLGTCDGNMEEGSMRVDVNVSVRRPAAPLGTRAEIKNVNSVRFIGQAISYEVDRQIDLLESGESVVQETRLFDAQQGITRSMRGKENANDYRYFTDPDLPPLVVSDAQIDAARQALPELPDAKKQRLVHAFDIPSYDASVIVAERDTADFYEKALAASKAGRALKDASTSDNAPALKATAKLLANWLIGDFFAALNRDGFAIQDAKVSPTHLAEMVDLIQDDVISGRIAKDVFLEMWATGQSPRDIVSNKGLQQITDIGALEAAIDAILAQELDKIAEYRSGKDKLFGYFVGQVMKATGGKANPALLNALLQKKLGASPSS